MIYLSASSIALSKKDKEYKLMGLDRTTFVYNGLFSSKDSGTFQNSKEMLPCIYFVDAKYL